MREPLPPEDMIEGYEGEVFAFEVPFRLFVVPLRLCCDMLESNRF